MNRDRIEGYCKHALGEIHADYGVTRQANEKQLAQWQERQHKVDPLHK